MLLFNICSISGKIFFYYFRLLCENPAHLCTKFCYQICGPCHYLVEKELGCGHSARMQCHIDPKSFKCQEKVMSILPCNHETERLCFIPLEKFMCPFKCEIRVEPCGHACTQPCHLINDPDHLEVST